MSRSSDTVTDTPLVPITEAYRRRDLPDVHVPPDPRTALRAGIAHIGVGNFHRVHQGVYLDDLLSARDDHDDWAILGIGLHDSPA